MDLGQFLQDAYDSGRETRLLDLTRALLGIADDESKSGVDGGVSEGGVWSHYSAFRPGIKQFKKVNHIQNRLRLVVANTRTTDLVPTFTNCQDDVQEIARRGWWEWRSQGKDGFGGWKTDFDNAFSDFAAIGEGHLRVGLIEGKEGAAVTVKHYHPLNVLLDPYAKYANESRWIAYSDVYSEREAQDRFPKVDWEAEKTKTFQKTGIVADGIRVIEYFCKESESGDYPSYAVFIQDLSGEPVIKGDNPFGDLIPDQTFLGFIPSGSEVPIGIVQATMYVEQELERIADDERKKSQRDNLFGIMPEMFHAGDWKNFEDGKRVAYLRINEEVARKYADMETFLTIPRNGENEDQKQLRAEYLAMLDQLSGVSSLDMGQTSGGNVTAREVSEVAARSQASVGFLAREFARGIQELAVIVGKVATMFDTAPFCVDADNIPVWFNRDGDKRLSSKELWKGDVSCVIGDEDLIKTDVNMKKQQDWADWMEVYKLTQNPNALREALLSKGIKNPDEFMPIPQPLASPGQQPISA